MAHRELAINDYLNILKRRWMLIVALAVCGAIVGYGASRILPKRYTSQTLVLVQQPTVPENYVKSVVSDNINQRLAAMQQQILSRARLLPIIHELGLYPKDVNRLHEDDLVERLRRVITITPIQPMAETRAQNLPGFYISVVFDNPDIAQQICAKITSMFLEENLQLRQDQAQQTTDFLGKQLQDAKAKLDEQDARLATFKRRFLGSLPDEQQSNLNLLTTLNTQLEAATQALARAQQDKSFAETVLGQQLSTWQSTSQTGQNPDTLELQVAAQQTLLATLQTKYTEDHPDVIKAKNDLASLRRKLAESEKRPAAPEKTTRSANEPGTIQQLRAQIHQYDQTIRERAKQQEEVQKQIRLYQGRIQSTPGVEQDYKLLTRDYQTALEFYNDLLKKRDQSAMATDLERRQQGEQFQVLDPANRPNKPSFPKVPLFAAGGFAGGLGLGLAITLFLATQDSSLKTERDVEIVLRLPVLAMVPLLAQETGSGSTSGSLLGSSAAQSGTRR